MTALTTPLLVPDLMRIEYLADHPGFILPLARWHHEQWAYLRPDDSVEARVARLRAACGRGEVPTAFVAFSDAILLGSAMLVAHDMETRMELTPWLAGVFVGPDYRRRVSVRHWLGKLSNVRRRGA
jgi:hypothetical protein